MFIATINGMVMNDYIKESKYDGKVTATRVILVFQAGSKELIEIKDVPEDFKFKQGEVKDIPCVIRYWKNDNFSGISIKYNNNK